MPTKPDKPVNIGGISHSCHCEWIFPIALAPLVSCFNLCTRTSSCSQFGFLLKKSITNPYSILSLAVWGFFITQYVESLGLLSLKLSFYGVALLYLFSSHAPCCFYYFYSFWHHFIIHGLKVFYSLFIQ